ncbi:efflux RND transporter periplasmic adaptor subunit [soil metagenome]
MPFFLFACGENEIKIKPEINTVTESVYASGIVKAQDQYNVYPVVTGLLQKIYVTEGDSVKQGDPLFLIENQTSALNTDNARLALELTEQNVRENSNRLRELTEAVNMARERMVLDSALFVRHQRLWNQNIGSQVELEQRKVAYETSRANYFTALTRYDQLKAQFEIEHQQARNNLLINQRIENNYTIRSEINGLVYDILKEQGEWVSSQGPIAVMGNPSRYLLSLQVDEYDIIKIRPGQKILVRMDSYRGKVFQAEISKVFPIMNERSRTFTVEAVFTHPPSGLFPNLTAEANIIIQTKQDALIIPREYLLDDQYVLISPEERAKVEVGLMDYQHVEILSGLDQNQFIYKP